MTSLSSLGVAVFLAAAIGRRENNDADRTGKAVQQCDTRDFFAPLDLRDHRGAHAGRLGNVIEGAPCAAPRLANTSTNGNEVH